VAAIYPLVPFIASYVWDQQAPKVLLTRITRATDSFVAAPILIALLVLLGNAGLPSKCETLFAFDPVRYQRSGNRSLGLPSDCNTTLLSNACGTGRHQVREIRSICRATRAGFGLVILTMYV
jgi:hypothetical protein